MSKYGVVDIMPQGTARNLLQRIQSFLKRHAFEANRCSFPLGMRSGFIFILHYLSHCMQSNKMICTTIEHADQLEHTRTSIPSYIRLLSLFSMVKIRTNGFLIFIYTMLEITKFCSLELRIFSYMYITSASLYK